VTRPWLRVSLGAFAILNLSLSAPLAVLIPVYVKAQLHLGARSLGLLFAVEGVSGGLAALAAGQARGPRRPVMATHVASASAGLAVAGLALSDALPVAVACLAVAGFLLELGNMYWTTAVQQQVPGDLLGRVSSVDWLMSGSLLPVGMAVVGAAAAATSTGTVFAVGGVANLLVASAAAVATRRTRAP
jgi:DHA3 family tetracycline resistance protein-like MFS transporter